MTNTVALIRTLLIYGLCLPLAVWLGYLLANPMDPTTFKVVGALFALLALPVLLKWHHLLLIAAWNTSVVVFFIRGSPTLWLFMSAISLGLALVQRTLNRHLQFQSVPSVTWSLVLLAGIILLTANLTGGIGLRVYGSEVMGGKRYILLLGAIIGYFALISRRIPPAKANWILLLFLAGGLTELVGSLIWIIDPSLYFIFLMFPPDVRGFLSLVRPTGLGAAEITRIGALTMASIPMFCLLVAHYGIRGIFDMRHWWRILLLFGIVVVSLLGGFRSVLIFFLLVLMLQFYYEGLFRSRLLPVILLCSVLAAAVAVPLVPKMPLAIQRALSFLPIEVDATARLDAEGSTNWRLDIWERVLPLVPKHFFLGKGYAIDPNEMIKITSIRAELNVGEEAELAGDYHSGPLSVIIPLGIWGVIAFTWFVVASLMILFHNHRFGDPLLQRTNTFLLVYFITKVIMFLFVFGSFHTEFYLFTGIVGLSISLNGGRARPQPAVAALPSRPMLSPRALAKAGARA